MIPIYVDGKPYCLKKNDVLGLEAVGAGFELFAHSSMGDIIRFSSKDKRYWIAGVSDPKDLLQSLSGLCGFYGSVVIETRPGRWIVRL